MGRGWSLAGLPRSAVSKLSGGVSRRDVLRGGLAAGVGAAGGILMGGAGSLAGGVGLRRAAASPIVLSVLPSQSWPSAIGPTLWGLLHRAIEPFLAANPGVEVNLFTNQGYQGATQAAMLAGTGPDVFSDWIMPPFVENNLLLDMGPYIRRDNLNVGIFPPGEMSFFEEAALFSPSNTTGLYAVPAYLHTEAYAVNLTVLDQLGLRYPQPDWTVKEWTALWESTTVKPAGGKKQRFGTDLDQGGYDYSYNMVTPYMFNGYGGEYVNPNDPTKSYLTSPGSLACGRAVYDMLWSGVAGNSGNFAQGTVVCTHGTCTCGGQINEAQQWTGFKWDYFEDPVWPVRKSSYAASDFYGIWAGTKHPEQAWELLKYLAFGPNWQRIVMQTALAGPNQARLWEEWVSIVKQFAPPLRDKNLNAFAQPVLDNEPYFGHVFRYSEAQVKTIIGNYSNLLNSKKVTVDEAFAQMDAQINAAQRTGAATADAERSATAAYAHYVGVADHTGAAIEYPAPSKLGPGSPSKQAGTLVKASPSGTYTVIGSGGGMHTGSDVMTFAGGTFLKSRGAVTVRLTGIAAQSGTGVADGARVGLVARSDLSNSGGEVALNLSMGRGLHLMVRPFAGGQGGDTKPPQHTLMLNGANVLAVDSTKASNYLLKPVWLRLVLDVNQWSAYTSFDGVHWTLAYAPVGAGFIGSWVGMFATANGGNNIVATFDHVSGFTPDTFVTIGS